MRYIIIIIGLVFYVLYLHDERNRLINCINSNEENLGTCVSMYINNTLINIEPEEELIEKSKKSGLRVE